MNILELIEKNVIKNGDRIAYECNNNSLTYEGLWELSDRLAKWILKKFGDDHRPIVVYGHKSPLQLICFLAAVKSGRPYCPIDDSMSCGRVEDIIKTVNGKVVFATETIDVEEDIIIGKDIIEIILSLEENKLLGEEKNWLRDKWTKNDETYYIIFTSGTTGKPKGVEISMNNLTNFINWFRGIVLNCEPNNVGQKTFLNQAPYAFDLSVMDTYTALTSGDKVHGVDKKTQLDMSTLMMDLQESKINYWVSTPSFATMCLGEKDFNHLTIPSLETMFFCGERLSVETCKILKERFPKTRIINTYGPTEATVAVSAMEINSELIDKGEELPVGLVKQGTEIIISSEGEIIILGDTVAKGYFGDETRTKISFEQINDKNGISQRAYRTGDKGELRQGLLYCHGRLDNQIKFHGYRMELGDIENNLTKLQAVKEAVVLPRVRNGIIKNLVAFLVLEENETDTSFQRGQGIREELKQRLPDYMVPKKINFIDKMPLSNNGKIDRKILEEKV